MTALHEKSAEPLYSRVVNFYVCYKLFGQCKGKYIVFEFSPKICPVGAASCQRIVRVVVVVVVVVVAVVVVVIPLDVDVATFFGHFHFITNLNSM